MQIAKVKKTSLLAPFNSTDTTMRLVEFVDHKGNALTISDFDNDTFVVTLRQGEIVEMVLCNAIVQNPDGSATLTVATNGRELSATFPYTGGTEGEDFNSGAEVVNGNDPYTIYKITIDYANSLAFAGGSDATDAIKGFFERATVAEINAATADGAGDTTAPLAITAARLAASIYGTRLPSTEEKNFLGATTGVVFPTVNEVVPSGFLLCDGQLIDPATYGSLASILKANFGLGAPTDCTVGTNDIFNATGHGLIADQIIYFESNDTLPAGLSRNTPYYVQNVTTNTFTVSETEGGGDVDITSTGTGSLAYFTQIKVPDLRGGFLAGKGIRSKDITFVQTIDVEVGSIVATATDAQTSSNYINTAAAHGLSNGDMVILNGGTIPSGLAADTPYYISRPTASRIAFYNNYEDAIAAGGDYNANGVIGIGSTTATCSVWSGGALKSRQPISKEFISGLECTIVSSGTLPAGVTGSFFLTRVDDYTFGFAKDRAGAKGGATNAFRDTGSGTITLTITNSDGTTVMGQEGGEFETQLLIENMPTHNHGTHQDSGGDNNFTSNQTFNTNNTKQSSINDNDWMEEVGGDEPHANVPPFVAMNYIIKT